MEWIKAKTIIPFITDSEKNIRNVIKLSAENGAKFVFSMGGVTILKILVTITFVIH